MGKVEFTFFSQEQMLWGPESQKAASLRRNMYVHVVPVVYMHLACEYMCVSVYM